MRSNKAPGPNFVLPEVTKRLATSHLAECKILFARTFPDLWMIAKLTLIEKPIKGVRFEKTYRGPICMLSGISKLVERIVTERIKDVLEDQGGLLPRQSGFRSVYSTVDAMRMVVDEMEKVMAEKNYRRNCGVEHSQLPH